MTPPLMPCSSARAGTMLLLFPVFLLLLLTACNEAPPPELPPPAITATLSPVAASPTPSPAPPATHMPTATRPLPDNPVWLPTEDGSQLLFNATVSRETRVQRYDPQTGERAWLDLPQDATPVKMASPEP